jgi:tRNA(Ile)-lysidine synthase
VQEKARLERYRLLGEWAADHKLDAIATGHHRDDQAETVAMRLARGSGVRGLAGMRKAALIPGCDIRLLRPLLDWSHAELAQICVDAGVEAVDDPSNSDDSYERVRVRRALADGVLIDPAKVAASAAALGEAEDAIAWTVERVWAECAVIDGSRIALQSAQLPPEIERRLIARAIASLASEGEGVLRGKEVDMVLERLREGGQATLRGVLCTGGADWQFVAAPHRTRRTTINR